MSASQLVKLKKGQHKVAVGIHIQIALRNSSIPIVMKTIKPVISIAVSVCVRSGKNSTSAEEGSSGGVTPIVGTGRSETGHCQKGGLLSARERERL